MLFCIFAHLVLSFLVNGDTVFIKECYDKLPKRIYALDIDGAAVIKRVIWGVDKITLLSENKNYPPRDITGDKLLNT
ncbi:S24 family peptidase [Mageeibacillus indolicus]|uniref:S24 family peptidase n=1 Tax=Mageeibacillus indolicus TaxID=884684 RepID=UPI003B848750